MHLVGVCLQGNRLLHCIGQELAKREQDISYQAEVDIYLARLGLSPSNTSVSWLTTQLPGHQLCGSDNDNIDLQSLINHHAWSVQFTNIECTSLLRAQACSRSSGASRL